MFCFLGPASSAKLLAPVSLACDSHGNVYVGDHNYIRKINTQGFVSSLLFLRNPPHKVCERFSNLKYGGIGWWPLPFHQRLNCRLIFFTWNVEFRFVKLVWNAQHFRAFLALFRVNRPLGPGHIQILFEFCPIKQCFPMYSPLKHRAHWNTFLSLPNEHINKTVC